jgi:high-affinity nickel-transport protein
MMALVSVMALGFVLGMRHAAEPDHLLAVATIVSRQRSVLHGALIGALWGVGHGVTILGVGTAIVAFGLVVSPRVALTLELAVAAMLVVLGIASLAAARRQAPSHAAGAGRALRPLLVGVVHGLAGSASVMLLVIVALPDPVWAGIYMLVFGTGTIAGMMVLTVFMSWPLVRWGRRSVALQHRVATTAGVLSVVLGLFLAYQIGVAGLFTGSPR